MEMESEDDEPAPQRSRGPPLRNPYPLEGKYVDEADREA